MQRSRRSPLRMKGRRHAKLTATIPHALPSRRRRNPAAGARETAAGIASQRHRPVTAMVTIPRRHAGRGQRDSRVVDQQQTPVTKDLAENRLLAERFRCDPERQGADSRENPSLPESVLVKNRLIALAGAMQPNRES